jgi:hypothetical protein
LPKKTKSIGGQSYLGSDDWKEKLVENFNEFEALHRELIERPHDPATIKAYEAYKKRSAERKSYKTRVSPSQLQSFGNTSLPKETKSIGGQSCPAEVNADNVITFDDLSEEQRQVYEVLKKRRKEEFKELKKKLEKKHEEEDLQEFLVSLKKDHQDNITQVGEIKCLLPRSNQVKPSAIPRQKEEALRSDEIHEECKNDSASMVN